MIQPNSSSAARDPGAPTPRRTPLRRILDESPQSRRRLSRAIVALSSAALVALAAIGVLLAWHIRRRARLVRERLGPPRIVRWPDLSDRSPDSSS